MLTSSFGVYGPGLRDEGFRVTLSVRTLNVRLGFRLGQRLG
jgi:hypothetical protein